MGIINLGQADNVIEEDGNGDIVANVDSINTDDLVLDGARPYISEGHPTITKYEDADVTVSTSGTQVIFDVTDPETILFGTIMGQNITTVTVTFGDGSTQTISDTAVYGRIGNTDTSGFSVQSFAVIENVTKLEFEVSAENGYGWNVLTRPESGN